MKYTKEHGRSIAALGWDVTADDIQVEIGGTSVMRLMVQAPSGHFSKAPVK